jgi:hypothetical protein
MVYQHLDRIENCELAASGEDSFVRRIRGAKISSVTIDYRLRLIRSEKIFWAVAVALIFTSFSDFRALG